MITPRRTRLVRVRDLHGFRDAIAAASSSSSLVVVTTAGAAKQVRRLVAQRRTDGVGPPDPPELVTRDDMYDRLHARLHDPPPRLSACERDLMAQAAAREASTTLGTARPFELRPGLVAEMLRFYDQLRRQAQKAARFEELLTEHLNADVELDRGAERMLQQTRLLAAMFRAYERRVAESGSVDEHTLRERLLVEPLTPPVRAVVVTVADWIAEPAGLYKVDFDLLSRLPGVETIDIIATERVLASGFHQRLDDWLPGLEEVEAARSSRDHATLAVPADAPDRVWFRSRDREEELEAFTRRLKAERRARLKAGQEPAPLDTAAVVYKRPLPYLYLAGAVFEGAGAGYQTSDALPLAAEPYAAALDLVLEFVASSFTRETLAALLRSPHFVFEEEGHPIGRESVSALDRELSEARYLGTLDHLKRLAEKWHAHGSCVEAMPALQAAVHAAEHLAEMQALAPASAHVDRLLSFLHVHDVGGRADGVLARRSRRARAAIVDTLEQLATASRSHGDPSLDVNGLAATVRRWIEEQTFDPELADHEDGIHLVDEQSARYGEFRELLLVGLIEGEWPDRPRRNIFYPPSVLRALGWPSERDWHAGAEARFLDLLGSPTERVWLSSITLDDEALVEPSSLLEEVRGARLRMSAADPTPTGRIFTEEALSTDPVATAPLEQEARDWAELRLARSSRSEPAFHGQAGGVPARTWSVSAVETYQQCPFKFFAQHVLRLEEEPEDEEVMDPRTQGEFVHAVFEDFFGEWQGAGHGAIRPETLDEARRAFEAAVDRGLEGLRDTEAALERTRLLGSPAAAGLGEAVLRMEAERPIAVVERLLEHRLTGDFAIQTADGSRLISLKGKADRIDLLADGTFRLIDYKLGWPPNRSRALQLPIYGICAEQALSGYRGKVWTLGEAAYVAFKGSRRVTPLFSPGDRDRVLRDAQQRLASALDAIERGEFPPRPDDVYRCETCAYAAVCRRDYVDDV